MKVKSSNPVVINIRGTCGSGKSTAVRQLIAELDGKPMFDEFGKIWAYNMQDRIFAVGLYEEGIKRAGADCLPVDDIYASIRRLAPRGSVIFESLFISGFYGKFRELENELRPTHHWIWCCLDTPYETCLVRAQQRRNPDNPRPFNPVGVQRIYRATLSTRRGLTREGRDVRTLDHQNTLPTLLDWLGERARRKVA